MSSLAWRRFEQAFQSGFLSSLGAIHSYLHLLGSFVEVSRRGSNASQAHVGDPVIGELLVAAAIEFEGFVLLFLALQAAGVDV